MITFLPFDDFRKSLESLDNLRLNKQKLETYQMIRILENPDPEKKVGYKNHPSTKMWVGYLDALKVYFNTNIDIWLERGFKNNMEKYIVPSEYQLPPWFGNIDFHKSHQASLFRKNTLFYKEKFPELEDVYIEKGYIWPRFINDKWVLEFSPITKPKPVVIPEGKVRNPLTNRLINIDGKIYNSLVKNGTIIR